ncbi:hypothetical protein DFH07DRAFT_1060139 [Mycena maculata]|uniref:RING-type domain-containing protein n=1 Tax=Mycena maculata TaxID=230809 RepID=A0AAD7NHH3_9AGAR|nr:hypothetical protein DFH07DRAFT_1060139 [Mycena maculata]
MFSTWLNAEQAKDEVASNLQGLQNSSDALLSDAVLFYLLIPLCIFSIFFVLSVTTGPPNVLKVCGTIFNCLKFVALDLIPVLIIATTTQFVFYVAFTSFLAWFSVAVGYDTDLPDAHLFRWTFTMHLRKIAVPDTSIGAVKILVFTLGLFSSWGLLILYVYERRKIAKDFNHHHAKRVAFENAIAEGRRTVQRCTKQVPPLLFLPALKYSNVYTRQLADVDASLACLICVDRLTQPYTLAPCGHTFDLECLQAWFRTAHPSPADEQLALTLDPRGGLFALRRKKFCPLCHAEVVGCPAPAHALLGLGMTPPEEGNPWKGLFVGVERSPARPSAAA